MIIALQFSDRPGIQHGGRHHPRRVQHDHRRLRQRGGGQRRQGRTQSRDSDPTSTAESTAAGTAESTTAAGTAEATAEST